MTPEPGTRFAAGVEWNRAIYGQPATAGIFLVRQGTEGEPFYARWMEDGIWRALKPDANGDGTRELGDRLSETNRLYYIA